MELQSSPAPHSLDVIRRFKNLWRRKFFDDDFNWNTYTSDKYGPQLKALDAEYDLQLDERVYFDRDTQRLVTGNAKLHPNHQVVYEVIGMLNVASVLEVGCGGGDHVRNLTRLYPQVDVRGGDRSEGQLELLRRRNPTIANRTFLQDITMPLSSKWPKADLVYSQAVIMHIKTAVSHLNALANMFNLANKYVVMMENFGCHHFVNDIEMLLAGGHLRWERVHFHVHELAGRPHCLVAAKEPCDLPKLQNYLDLPGATKKR